MQKCINDCTRAAAAADAARELAVYIDTQVTEFNDKLKDYLEKWKEFERATREVTNQIGLVRRRMRVARRDGMPTEGIHMPELPVAPVMPKMQCIFNVPKVPEVPKVPKTGQRTQLSNESPPKFLGI